MNSPLTQTLAGLVRAQGPIPFDLFMEKALYHPGEGYYASGKTRVGRGGDFLTPVSAGPGMGQLLARQADEMHRGLGRPRKIRFIEQGADTGWLARDLIGSIRQNHPELAGAADFHLIEPQPPLVQKQREALAGTEIQARWHSSWETMPQDAIPCFFYSCELVDSFPVRIFRYRNRAWREQRVGWAGSGFCWQETDVDSATLAEILRWKAPELEGFSVELRPGAKTWVKSWAQKITQGLVLTMDYGFPAEELFSPDRSAGTLVALRGHQRSGDPLADPGQQDLTAHVNFTELAEVAAREAWKNYGLTDFSRGWTALATPLLREDIRLPEPWIRNFRHLTHPSLFGRTHKILVLGKSLPSSFTPSMVMKI